MPLEAIAPTANGRVDERDLPMALKIPGYRILSEIAIQQLEGNNTLTYW
jgi:hypothetical protein